MTPSFDWDRDVNVPVSGRTARARHASASGAQVAAIGRGAKTRDYLRLLWHVDRSGGLNDDAAARLLGVYRTSICSIRNACMLAGLVEETGVYDVAQFGARTTRRQRYRLTARGGLFLEAR